MSLTKFVAVTAVAACAGGGAVVAGAASGSTPPTPVVLQHFVCAGHHHSGRCAPAQVVLPDSTTFGVTDPLARLECHGSSQHRRHHDRDTNGTSAAITNELTSAPVQLDLGSKRTSCAVGSNGQRLARFSCFEVGYPSGSPDRFTPPNPVTVDGHDVTVLDPSRLCVPDGAANAGAPDSDLLCFDVQVAAPSTSRRHQHHDDVRSARLCVPSTDTSVARNPTSTTTTGPTTTTTTTTTTTPTSQPCAGRIVNGVCIIDG